jgi:hypothetical protein
MLSGLQAAAELMAANGGPSHAPSSPDGVALLSSRPMADYLSPAASAIVAAFSDRHELCGPFDGNWPDLCLAAALRAAADHLRNAYANEECIDSADDFLDGIAAELEAT